MTENWLGRLKKIVFDSKILKNGVLSLFGTFLIKAVNLVSIPVFSRLMNTDEYGQVSIFMTYASVFSILLGLDFLGAVSKGCLDFKGEKNQFMSVGAVFTGIYTFAVICIVNLFHSFFCRLLSMDWLQLNILMVYSYASFIITYLSAEYIFYFNYKMNTLMSMAVALGNFGTSVVLMQTVFCNRRILGRILGAAVPTVLIAAGIFVYLVYRGKTYFNKRYLAYFMKMGIPLIPHNLSHLLLGNADKVMIDSMIGSRANGIYSLVYNVGWMLSVLVDALNNVWSPWMFRILKNGSIQILRNAFNLYMAGFAVVTILIENFSPEIVMLIAPPEYWEGIQIVVWIVFSGYLSFMYIQYVNFEFYEKKTYLISIGTFMAAIVNILLNLFFLHKYGYQFAAISTVVSYLALVIFHMCIVVFVLKKDIINWRIFVFLIGAVFCNSLLVQIFLKKLLLRILLAIMMSLMLAIVFFCPRFKLAGK